MDHKLRVLIRLDIDRASATLAVTGCLTESSVPALFPLIRRAGAMIKGPRVIVVLDQARHVDQAGLDLLRKFAADPTLSRWGHAISISAPAALPPCPALQSIPAEKIAV
ncbi:hypothetical protein [Arthrobacter roseus]|uniref:hypothetical protein n=1 Tax=Arthrobacter roseus TaxID=136274 RepID=UPI0019635ACF|nr:hypothetical protein [Arthrobacter roseus]MBM7847409.1 ABC-type transporter Mla MlaB component [Arthrobacter roseus]